MVIAQLIVYRKIEQQIKTIRTSNPTKTREGKTVAVSFPSFDVERFSNVTK